MGTNRPADCTARMLACTLEQTSANASTHFTQQQGIQGIPQIYSSIRSVLFAFRFRRVIFTYERTFSRVRATQRKSGSLGSPDTRGGTRHGKRSPSLCLSSQFRGRSVASSVNLHRAREAKQEPEPGFPRWTCGQLNNARVISSRNARVAMFHE